MKKRGVEILSLNISPFSKIPCISLRLPLTHFFSGCYLITPTEESGLPIKPPCLYGME